MNSGEIFQFGEFQIDARARTVRREKAIVTLNSRSFDVLLYFVQHPGRVLAREEILKNVWPDAFVDEHSLAQSISVLRRVLEEKPGDNDYIVTLPGRGYQFVSPITVVPPERSSVIPDGAAPSGNASSGLLLERQTIRTSVITEEKEQLSLPIARRWGSVRPVAAFATAAILLVSVAILGGNWYWRSHRAGKLTDQDTIVLADFDNRTGDPVFDDTLKTALSISLRQSPFLALLPEGQVRTTLQQMTRPPGTKLTPEVARELCQRAGSKAFISGAIAGLGSEYVLELKAVNCQSGDILAQEQVTAAPKEKVLDALGKAASNLRGELGESLATVQKFDVPLVQATTSSLEALKEYSMAEKSGGEGEARAHRLRAIELDPKFAIAYLLVGNSEGRARASEYFTKAFQLRDHASEREQLRIEIEYYVDVTGELDKAARAGRDMIESYPRDPNGYISLGVAYMQQGEYEKGEVVTRQGVRAVTGKKRAPWYSNLAEDALALQRFGEARQIILEAEGQKAVNSILHSCQYVLAFLQGDATAMSEQQQWSVGKPFDAGMLQLASDTEAYGGHLRKQRELTRRAVDAAIREDDSEEAGISLAIAAQREAAFGNASEARRIAAEGSKLAPASLGVESELALAFALAGNTARAESLAQDLDKRFPLHTQMQSIWLPAIRAQLALNRKDPVLALKSVQVASPIELGSINFAPNTSCLYSVYERGEAYLAAGQGRAAAAEFQRILDHSGVVMNCWTGALAHLGVARANALQAKTAQGADADAARVRALAAYKDFLSLWKDADPDIPILKEAKAEFAKLQ
jgi:DNA-binding winged helix-turn-helix (wHTH) protein